MSDNQIEASIIAGPYIGKCGRVVTPPTSKGKPANGHVGVFDKNEKRAYFTPAANVFIHDEKETSRLVANFRQTYRLCLKAAVDRQAEENGRPGRTLDPFGQSVKQKAMAEAVKQSPSVVALAYRAYADRFAVIGKGEDTPADKTPMEQLGHHLMIAAGAESKMLRRLYLEGEEPATADSVSGVEVAVGRFKAALGLEAPLALELPGSETTAALMGLDPADVHQAKSRLAAEGYRVSAGPAGMVISSPLPPKSELDKAKEKVAALKEGASTEKALAAVNELLSAVLK